LDEIKQALSDLVIESLMIGLNGGHITEEQFMECMQEVNEMQNDSSKQIRELVLTIAEERGRRRHG
jgi:hypothetical protein